MINAIPDPIKRILASPMLAFSGIFLISALSLMMALIAQYIYGLQPCVLCIYQRVPFVVNSLIGIGGMGLLYKHKWSRHAPKLILGAALVFLAGSIIAFYHVGVEQHWWKSFLEGCAVSFDPNQDAKDLMALFDNQRAVRCDEVAWADPILGISMAGYNFMMSLGLAVVCALSALLTARKNNGIL